VVELVPVRRIESVIPLANRIGYADADEALADELRRHAPEGAPA
jgi:hypothetical protein